MSFLKKERIDFFIIEVEKYYKDCSLPSFPDINLPEKLNKEELQHLNDNLKLEEIVCVQKKLELVEVLKTNSKDNFAYFLLRAKGIAIEVNYLDYTKSTVFIELAKKYFESKDIFFIDLFINLFDKGYKIRVEDSRFIEDIGKKNFKNEESLYKWTYLRFAQKLDSSEKFALALKKRRELFTILSFHLGKPLYTGHHNLLGIAINAMDNFKECGDIILKAMKISEFYTEIVNSDRKGTLKRKIFEYEKNKPFQDNDFEVVAKIIFPKLL